MLHFTVVVPLDDGRRDQSNLNQHRKNAVISAFRDLPKHLAKECTYSLIEAMGGSDKTPIVVYPTRVGNRIETKDKTYVDEGYGLSMALYDGIVGQCRKRAGAESTTVIIAEIRPAMPVRSAIE